MLDAQNRTIIPKETFPDNPFSEGKEIYFYYKDENKILISTEENEEEMLIGRVSIDQKRRFTVPTEIVNAFGSRNAIVGKREGKYYFIFFPMKKD